MDDIVSLFLNEGPIHNPSPEDDVRWLLNHFNPQTPTLDEVLQPPTQTPVEPPPEPISASIPGSSNEIACPSNSQNVPPLRDNSDSLVEPTNFNQEPVNPNGELEFPEYMNVVSQDTINLSVWPPAPVPFSCTCCQVIRDIRHTNGNKATRLEVHGRVGVIFHAVLEIRYGINMLARPNTEYRMIDFSAQTTQSVKQYLMQYCQQRRREGCLMLQDPLSAFYDALSVGQNWDANASTDELIHQPWKANANMGEFVDPAVQNESGVSQMGNPIPNTKSSRIRLAQRGAPTPVIPTPEAGNSGVKHIQSQRDTESNGAGLAQSRLVPQVILRTTGQSCRDGLVQSRVATQRKRTANLQLKDLSGHFYRPIQEAAKELSVCASVIKKVCRKYGVQRWPQRKVTSIEKKIAELEKSMAGRRGDAHAHAELDRLRHERNQIYATMAN
uniref:RWP-RK domain-containing protein n=1 Tax=Nelumbo nucifera TaxID=4432 RepID=A0A823A195_NELNU|nr:TPA_asm: hypothetical protein HUJ06_019016 [Nelumbo nucifera]